MSTYNYTKIIFCDDRAEFVEAEFGDLGPDEILIKTSRSLISPGTERAALTRIWDDAWFRENPGYALAGEVIEAGRNVRDFQAGERVITLKNHANRMVASTDPWETLKIPQGVSNEEATFLPLASVALHGLRRAQITLGEPLVILGAGIIGQIAVQLAKMDGASQVIVLDLAENRLEQARRYGADLTINPSQEDAQAKIFEATAGLGAPVILEATGNVRAIPEAIKLAAHGGRIICSGLTEGTTPIPFPMEFLARELSLIAAHQPHCPVTENLYWRWTQQANRKLLLELLAAGKLRVSELVTHRFPASGALEAYEQIKAFNKDMLGVILEWE